MTSMNSERPMCELVSSEESPLGSDVLSVARRQDTPNLIDARLL